MIADFVLLFSAHKPLGISEQTITRICTEYEEKGIFSIPKKRYAHSRICKDAPVFMSITILSCSYLVSCMSVCV